MDALYMGVARKIITPEVGCRLYGYYPDIFSTTVADDLTVEAFCLQQGETKAMLISATVCAIATDLCDELRKAIQEKCGVPA